MDNLDKPIFIVGLPRTGSTLWHNIITGNAKIFRIGEMHFLTPWRKDFRYFTRKEVGDLSIKENIETMIRLIFSSEIIRGITGSFWHNDLHDVNDRNLKKVLYLKIQGSDKSLESIFKIIIEEITTFKGYSRYCVKFPVYVNYVPQLLLWYPQCKIIHITRDPRAMAMSRTNDPEGTMLKIKEHPRLAFIIRKLMIIFVVLQYIWTSRLHCKYKSINNYALFRYEDLLSDPEKIIKELCKFAEVDFVPEMLEPKEGQASSVTGKKQKGFDKKTASRWIKRISAFDKALVTLLTKGSMKRFGYYPNNHPVFHDG